jgi:hypothetical protein
MTVDRVLVMTRLESREVVRVGAAVIEAGRAALALAG